MTYQPHAFPVSVKGVVVQHGRVLLLKNERDEWELPGGKLELGEALPERLRVRIAQESGWQVTVGPILDSWQYHIREGVDVLIVTYGAHVDSDAVPTLSGDYPEAALFDESEVACLNMPEPYKRSIADWYGRLRESVR
ncbi:NUDIX domain-containing protein [Longispora sp. NPDC051575]|uniref:NUDIX hydrolase n=1 Tax=Longispora sp. NPDC051575 TaxID=3154943 RepID=UPI00341DFAAE